MSQSITTQKLASHLVGLTIVAANLRPFDGGRSSPAFNPVLTLSDGSKITFLVQETEVGEYGVEILRHVTSRKPK